MAIYRVRVRKTMLVEMEIEAETPEDADRLIWDVPEDEQTVLDADDTVECVIGPDDTIYYFHSRQGKYKPEPK